MVIVTLFSLVIMSHDFYVYCFYMTVTKQSVSPHSLTLTHTLSGDLMDSWLFSCSCFLWLLNTCSLSPYPWTTRYDLEKKKETKQRHYS